MLQQTAYAGEKLQALSGATRRPKVTVLTDIPFWEPTLGSHVRVANIMRALDGFCDLSAFVFRTVGPHVRSSYNNMKLKADLVSYKLWERKLPVYQVGAFSGMKELRASAKPSWVDAATRFLAQNRPDYVIIEYINRSYLLDAVPPGTKTILDTHDVMSQRGLAFALAGKSASIQLGAQSEARLLGCYDAVMAISPHDADVMRHSMGLRNVLHVTHPATVTPPPSIRPVGNRLIFVGGKSEANISGLQWFLDQVWPAVRDRCELHVVGAVSDILNTDDSHIIAHGIVDDINAIYGEADIAINPVFVGGGIKIKTLDAMAYGLPCITTQEGARGLEDAVGAGLLVAQSRLEFVSITLSLLDDQARRTSVSAAAQSYIRSRHSPEIAYRDLLLFLTHA